MKIKKRIKNKGVILIEAILALAVIVAIMTALVTALVSTLSSTTFSNEQTLASNFAQEGLEIARNQKDNDFDSLLILENDSYCLGETQSEIGSVTSCSKNIGTKFTRKIYINKDGEDGRKSPSVVVCAQEYTNPTTGAVTPVQSIFVASTVTWSDSRCSGGTDCHKVELNACFVNLNILDNP